MLRKFLPRHSLLSLIKIRINTGDWISVVVMMAITLLMAVNLWRVTTNAVESLDVFAFEQNSLEESRSENAELRATLEYHQSYEYKKLYARDNQRLAEADEKLFKVIEPIDYYQVEEKLPELFAEGNYSSWWLELI